MYLSVDTCQLLSSADGPSLFRPPTHQYNGTNNPREKYRNSERNGQLHLQGQVGRY